MTISTVIRISMKNYRALQRLAKKAGVPKSGKFNWSPDALISNLISQCQPRRRRRHAPPYGRG
jgi:hypothetical protein